MEASSNVQVENARVRVTRWHLSPGAHTGPHRHALDYVVVPLDSGDLLLEGSAGRQTSRVEAGAAYFREAGVEHDVHNASDHAIDFVEMELKEPPRPP